MKQTLCHLRLVGMMSSRRKTTRIKILVVGLVVLICLLILFAVVFQRFREKQIVKDENVNTDVAEFIVPDQPYEKISGDSKEDESQGITGAGTEKKSTVGKSTAGKSTVGKNTRSKNTTEQNPGADLTNPDGSNNNNTPGNNTQEKDDSGNHTSNGREKNELEIIPTE